MHEGSGSADAKVSEVDFLAVKHRRYPTTAVPELATESDLKAGEAGATVSR